MLSLLLSVEAIEHEIINDVPNMVTLKFTFKIWIPRYGSGTGVTAYLHIYTDMPDTILCPRGLLPHMRGDLETSILCKATPLEC